MSSTLSTWAKFRTLTRLEHALFALPFSLAAMLYAAQGLPPFRVGFWALVALLSGRSLGMAMNRLIDRRVDGLNPRTEGRLLPRGLVGVTEVKLLALGCAALLCFATWSLNPLCLKLLPLALLLLLGYSRAKFYTPLCHWILGATLGSATAGSWLAVTGQIDPPVWALFFGVTFWTAGFDIIYACQDIEVDRELGLFSVPAWLGRDRALNVSLACHALSLLSFGVLKPLLGAGSVYTRGFLVWAVLMALEHAWARTQGDAAVQASFFYCNIAISFLFLATAVGEVFG